MYLYGATAPQPKISMFCTLFQNYQHLFEKKKMIRASYSKLSKELKNGIEILVGPVILSF